MKNIKVMSVNIRYINNHDKFSWKVRKNILFSIIRKYNPDIIGFQEVMPESLSDLISEFSDYSFYGEFRDDSDSREMNPIFVKSSKYEISNPETFWLSENPSKKFIPGWDAKLVRVLSQVIVKEISSGEEFRFINTHFDHVGEIARQKSADFVISLFENSKLPTISTGDYNTTPQHGYIEKLLNHELIDNSYKHLEDKENSLTIHDFTGEIKGGPIDYIFVGNGFKIESAEIIRDTIDGIFPSDHYQVLAEISL